MKTVVICGIEILVEEAEKYIQINDINESDLVEIWEPLTKRYSGYNIVFCFHDTPAPVETLTAIDAVILDDCLKLELTPREFKPHDFGETALLTEAGFCDFAALHDKLNPHMYWTSRRIRDNLDIWRIFVTKVNGGLSGYIMLMNEIRDENAAEIFCLESRDPSHRKALLSAAAHCAFGGGKSAVIYMADSDDVQTRETAMAIGFGVAGSYQAFQVRV